jgi:hypothetical protein
MKKRLEIDEILATEGPMNSVALSDAKVWLGLDGRTQLTPEEERLLRAKKKKIVTSSKKLDRRVDRELTRRADRLDS